MIKNGIIITRNKVIDTTTGCGGSLEIHLTDDETGETIVWRKDLMEMVEEAGDTNCRRRLGWPRWGRLHRPISKSVSNED